jgi:hypothetical protein
MKGGENMAKNEAHDRIVEALSQSSPLLSEAAELLAETSLPVLGLPSLEEAKAKPNVAAAIKADGVSLADQLTRQVQVVSAAAPDIAVAVPNFAVAAVN